MVFVPHRPGERMSPEAKFIHMRDPCEVFPFTVRLLRAMSLKLSNMSSTECKNAIKTWASGDASQSGYPRVGGRERQGELYRCRTRLISTAYARAAARSSDYH